MRSRFLYEGLDDLDAKLKQLGQRLHYASERVELNIRQLCQQLKIDKIGIAKQTGVYEQRFIAHIEQTTGLTVEHQESLLLFEKDQVPLKNGALHSVFTAFREQIEKEPVHDRVVRQVDDGVGEAQCDESPRQGRDKRVTQQQGDGQQHSDEKQHRQFELVLEIVRSGCRILQHFVSLGAGGNRVGMNPEAIEFPDPAGEEDEQHAETQGNLE